MTNTSNMEKIFDPEFYYYFMQPVLNEEHTQKEVDFAISICGLHNGSRVLDIPCGYGRHSKYLAPRVKEVVGVDNNEAYLEIARKTLREMDIKNISLVHNDMRTYDPSEKFDCVLMLFTSFGLFSRDDNLKVLETISKCLKVGGKFCIDLIGPNSIKKNEHKEFTYKNGNDAKIDRAYICEESNKYIINTTYSRGNKRHEVTVCFEIYSFEELQKEAAKFNLRLTHKFGNSLGGKYKSDSFFMYVVGEK